MPKNLEQKERVVIRFAGDSGDGMQLTGTRFTETSGMIGNDIATLPDYPAEIRAPAGSVAGVSAFQLQFSSTDIHTPGDYPDVLIAMNPAALKVHLQDLPRGGYLIVNENAFTAKNLKFAGYKDNPLKDGSLEPYLLLSIKMSEMVKNSCEGLGLKPKLVDRTKNFFALGVCFWMFDRPLKSTLQYLEKKFGSRPELVEANSKALNAGYNYGETTEIFTTRFKVDKANLPSGTYRNVTGNLATCIGLAAAAKHSGIPLFYGGYPITPASEILHQLAVWRNYGIKTFQAEDEIAGITAAIGAAFAGNLAVTASSGPGIALKGEAIGLAIIAELPLVIVNVQRGGPRTGLPTQTEQSDLFQAMYGRNGDAPLPVIAAQTPGDCFYAAYEAAMVAVKYMTPIILLTDGYLANGSEPWKIPDVESLEKFKANYHTSSENEPFHPYERDKKTLRRPWAIPGTPGLEHRIGGLEKENITGNVSYDPVNHHTMTTLRAEKIAGIVNEIPKTPIFGDTSGDVLILSWGGTYGSAKAATEILLKEKSKVGHCHLRWINPLPKDLGAILIKYNNILIPEINYGQLIKIIRGEYLVDAKGLNLVRGRPYSVGEIVTAVKELVK